MAQIAGWLAQQSEDRIRVRAIFGQCEQSELAGLARYYYGLSQLPLQELTSSAVATAGRCASRRACHRWR